MKQALIILAALFIVPVCLMAQSLPFMPPEGYDQEGLYPAGAINTVTYWSPSMGAENTMWVYTPPGYNTNQRYPVIYAYPGINSGADTIFAGWCVAAGTLADNLIGQGKISPVIIVAIDDNNGDVASDTLNVIIPYLDSNYSTIADADHRGLYGYSWGGGYTFNIGCSHLDTFHHLSPSSAAPNKAGDDQLFPFGGAEAKEKLKTLLISCGDADWMGLYPNSLNAHDYCVANGIPHYWLSVAGGNHDAGVWRPAMWNFLQLMNTDPLPTPAPRSAFSKIEAETFSSHFGIQTETCSEGGTDVGYIEDGDYLLFNNIDFENGAASFRIRVASAAGGGNIEIRLDSINGPLAGICSVNTTEGWQSWTTVNCNVSDAAGIHNLYLLFTGGGGYLFNLNWFQFSSTAVPTPAPGILSGDVNNSGTVDIVDALQVAQYYVGLEPQGFNPGNADVNCDGSINIVDALRIAQFYVGLISELSCNTAPTPFSTPTPVIRKIMPLGDSITDGIDTPGGYRIKLWQSIQNTGKTADFVGSLSNGPEELADHDHEGHSGWRIDQINSNISGWMDTYKPEILLLHIGTNDVIQDNDVANAPARLSALIDKICAKLPAGGKIYVAKIIPMVYSNQNIINFNNQVPGIVQNKVNEGKPVYLVDMYNAIPPEDLADGVHPTPAGYDKMAEVWFNAIRNDL